jgi:hypothetical protein
MFSMDRQLFVLEIPKNASRSLVTALKRKHKKHTLALAGHFTLTEMIERIDVIPALSRPVEPYMAVAIIRNPLNRLISQVRQAERMKTGITLDEIMEKAWEQSDVVFKPQWKYLEVPTGVDSKPMWAAEVLMWDEKRVDEAVALMTGGEDLCVNKSPDNSRFSAPQIVAHKMTDELFESQHHYKPDFALWLRAQRTNKYGEEP